MGLFHHVKDLGNHVKDLGGDAVKVGKDVVHISNDVNQLSLLAVTTVADKATAPVRAGANQLYNENKELINGAGNIAKSAGSQLYKENKDLIAGVGNIAKGAAGQVKDGIDQGANITGHGILRIAQTAKQMSDATANAVNDNLVAPTLQIVDDGAQIATGAATTVVDGATQVTGAVVDGATQVTGTVVDGATQVTGAVVGEVEHTADQIETHVSNRPMTSALELALPPLFLLDAKLRGNAEQAP